MTLDQLCRIRWAVRATLLLGVAASVVANVLHAVDNPISQSIAAWPPLALLLTVELISRIPVHSRLLAATRILATATIAGIAAWVSYWHMVGVASRYGEVGASPYLMPLSVDGLIVVASICLVELGSLIRSAEPVPVELPADDEPVQDEPAPDPWAHAVPVQPEPVQDDPRPKVERVKPSRPSRSRPRSLTSADRVMSAHLAEPEATHERIAELAGVSVSTVKRYRAKSSAPELLPGETPLFELAEVAA